MLKGCPKGRKTHYLLESEGGEDAGEGEKMQKGKRGQERSRFKEASMKIGNDDRRV